jgi:tetratricopeptide (TPR) repeat protein
MKVRIAATATILILMIAAAGSVLFAWSDLLRSSGDLSEIQHSIQLTPIDTRPMLREAAFRAAVDPLGKEDEKILQRATTLNPRDAEAWMALGLKAEMQGNLPLAEKDLLHAADLDHTFKPAWTLANFYVRSGDDEKFWHWIRICIDLVEPRNAEILTFDPRPMFALCWNVTDNANQIFERAIPRKHFILRSYLTFLASASRFDAALPVARELFPMAEKVDFDVLINLCNSMITLNNPSAAIEIWNAMIQRKLLSYAELNPAAGISLTNGDLRVVPARQGFDWRFIRPGGIYETYSGDPSFVRLDFDGDEPEHCDVLSQVVPLVPGRRYRLEYRYETTGLPAPVTGLRWAVAPTGFGDITAREEGGKPGETSSFEFTAPLDKSLVNLGMKYDRAPGTVKIKGSFKLSRADLRMLP